MTDDDVKLVKDQYRMRAENIRVPDKGIQKHDLYNDDHEMYLIVGHSKALSSIMSEYLNEEIVRGVWWFYLSLLGGMTILLVIFSYVLERKLQFKVSRPISMLSK